MHVHCFRSSLTMSLIFPATLGLVVASSWPAPAQAPRGRSGREPQGGPPRSQDGPGPGGSAPYRPRGVSTDATKGKMPPGAQILLERRRAEVRELEAAWAAKRREVEQHLADIVFDANWQTKSAEANLRTS